jgi:hypothetical protein
MHALFEQLRVCNQAEFDAEINASQHLLDPIMRLFHSGIFSSQDLKKITFVTMQTLERMAGLIEGCHSLIFLTPPVAAFMLHFLKFTATLAGELFKRQDSQTAQVMLQMICVCHLPFYQSSFCTILPQKDSKNKFALRPCILNVRDIGELRTV